MTRLSRPLLRVVEGGQAGPDSDPSPESETVSLDFDSVFRRYVPYVASVGYRLLGRDGELDDLVQDVFLEVHRGLSSIRDVGAIRGWLARICVRHCIRRLRGRRVRAFLGLQDLEHDPRLSSHAATPEQSAQVAAVYRILENMPVDQRVVWVLRYIEEESLDDIAILCACSKSTVQRRLRAAHERVEKGLPHDEHQ